MKWIILYEAENRDIINEYCDHVCLFFEATDELRPIMGLIVEDGDDIDLALDKVKKAFSLKTKVEQAIRE